MAKRELNWVRFLLGAAIKHQRQAQGLQAHADEMDEFRQYYVTHIEPRSRKYENQRVISLNSLRQRLYLSSGILVGAAILALLFQPYFIGEFQSFAPWSALLLMLSLGWWSYRPVARYQTNIKNQIFPRIFAYFGNDFIFSTTHRMSLSSFKAAKLLPQYDKASFDDYVQGTYQGVELALNEIKLSRRVQQNKRTRDQQVFTGLAIEIQCHKPFYGHTLVITNRGSLVNFFSDKHHGLNQVKLEDPQFEKRFDVFTTDQIEARYLLTTAFMPRLQKLARSFDGSFQCAFHQQKLFILLDSKLNRFELDSMLKGVTFEYEFSQINKEMKQLFAIIDVLKLDEFTGL